MGGRRDLLASAGDDGDSGNSSDGGDSAGNVVVTVVKW
jgi:hypothetical protein